MKKLPLGIQNFREMISGGYVYVDKTRFVYNLINSGKYYFLSRPRRFGKSLLLDTIAEAFSGDRELFKGLWIYGSDYEFEKHPVVSLDMSSIANETPETLKSSLRAGLIRRMNEEGFNVDSEIPSDIFSVLIGELYKKHGQKVVVLIDEYDKPILDHITNTDIAEANREILRGFYGILKSMDQCLRMTFITGVSKFTKTSIFSELNNLTDITLTREYACICGIPVEDLRIYFSDHIENMAALDEFKLYENLSDEILAWYDGYSWDGVSRLLNPFGLLTFLYQKRFSSFWYASGSPKFLMDVIRRREQGYANLQRLSMGEWALDSFDIGNVEVEPLLFQTGYLTVKETLPGSRPPVYILGMPNYEVRIAFNLHILAEFTEKGGGYAESAYRRIKESLETGDLQSMLNSLKGLFASIPYELHIKHESYYHSIFFAIMNLLGFDIVAEVSVSGGRVDAVLELAEKAYVIEFKYEHCEKNTPPEEKQKLFDKVLGEGMNQIIDKGYADKFAGSGKDVVLAAFAFLGRDDIELSFKTL